LGKKVLRILFKSARVKLSGASCEKSMLSDAGGAGADCCAAAGGAGGGCWGGGTEPELEPSRVNAGRRGTAARVAGKVGWIVAVVVASSLIFSGSAVGVIDGFSTSSILFESLLLAFHTGRTLWTLEVRSKVMYKVHVR
jgi:hypothetical protein